MIRNERRSEELARRVVETIRPDVKLVRRDFGGHSIRDFDLLYRDGRCEPLEVTEATLPDLNSAVRAHGKHVGYVMAVDRVTHYWHVFPTVHSDFKAWNAERVGSFLRLLETVGLTKFMYARDALTEPSVGVAARQLGISYAIAHDGTTGRVLDPGVLAGAIPIAAVEDLALVEDDRLQEPVLAHVGDELAELGAVDGSSGKRAAAGISQMPRCRRKSTGAFLVAIGKCAICPRYR